MNRTTARSTSRVSNNSLMDAVLGNAREVAQELRTEKGFLQLVKTMSDQSFRDQAVNCVQQMREDGTVPDFLTPQYYGRWAQAELRRSDCRMETVEDLKVLAKDLNPVIGFYDPLNLSSQSYWQESNEATIGWLRHAEIKHGRVAMAGFVGYIIHENGIRWPWPLAKSLPDYSTFEGLSAPEVWDAIPFWSKFQILHVIGFFEWWSESSYVLEKDGTTHYMRGGKPGYFPTFDILPHPVPWNLFDPFGFQKNKSDEWKAKKLQAEINNGRLAMLGLFSLLSEAKAPGSVPILGAMGISLKPYTGDVLSAGLGVFLPGAGVPGPALLGTP